jgi:predicted nuclease with RNAse H fold
VRALGIDVGVTKGLDLVLMEDDRIPSAALRGVRLEALGAALDDLRPDLVAIDAPPGWARQGGSRQTERELRRAGIQSFGTPTARRASGNAWYEWMRAGFRAFRIADRKGFTRYANGDPRGRALEVFPHATAVVLAGCLPPPAVPKHRWRREVLAVQGVPTRALRSADLLDAALAALTGLLAAGGERSAPGDPSEGVIVLPARRLPPRPYRRCRRGRREAQPRLPGMSPCQCGDPRCGRLTAREFAPGHDAKRKSLLWRLAREGHDAADELRSRGWELPPEMR